MKTRRRARPVVRLPSLDAANALALINVLDAAIVAIWRAHRHAILELEADLTAAAPRVSLRRSPRQQRLF